MTKWMQNQLLPNYLKQLEVYYNEGSNIIIINSIYNFSVNLAVVTKATIELVTYRTCYGCRRW